MSQPTEAERYVVEIYNRLVKGSVNADPANDAIVAAQLASAIWIGHELRGLVAKISEWKETENE